ncbi:cytochrome P450, partial [Ceratobasidium sp. AG-I]
IAFPRVSDREGEYQGYRIPKGSIRCLQGVHLDECLYNDPKTFNPDRFLDEDLPAAPAFGWGRKQIAMGRLCPGNHLAQATVFIPVTSILATFNITKLKDEKG